MFTREKFCAVCGCLFSLPDIRDPVNPDSDENPLLAYGDCYDSRILPQEMTEWLTGFRVVGHCQDIDSSLVNESSAPNFFKSPPAIWDYGMGAGEPAVPTVAGKTTKISVYEPADNANGMLFPLHQTCLNILQRLCQIRQAQNRASTPETPKTLDAFCDALQQRRRMNFAKPDKSTREDYYYASSGGIEWPHDYYGARRFWADEWNTDRGWELLCADPSPLKVPKMSSYLLSELPKSSSTSTTQISSNNQLADRLGWLFPEEADTITGNETGNWEEGIQVLLEKADLISADEGGEDEGKKKLASVPLGLKNRWRIWKILQGIRLD